MLQAGQRRDAGTGEVEQLIRLRPAEGLKMDPFVILGGLVAALLFVFLLVALITPERFS